ncbi:MAG: lecithin retinol acyltransferase family protein [Acholeplasmatales bacterium]|nr:lecithin retinol acyltransferase family protein [Acholeplasmatales bacterium]
MRFVSKKPSLGDQLKVNRGFYDHHGIYVGDDKVIQFGSTTGELDPKKAMVIETSLDDFLKGGELLVAEYNEEDLKKKRSPEEIVKYAKAHLGDKGYDVMNNNCEHFSNECAFGEHKSFQVDNIMSLFHNLFGGN